MDKEEAKVKAKNSIDQITEKIESMEQKKDEITSDVKNEFEEQMKNIKSLRTEMRQKYDEMKQKTDARWEDAQEAFSLASNKFEQGFSELKELVN
mgnify:CR=1 FL=1